MDSSPAGNLVSQLLDIKAIKLQPEDPFTWASGLRSPIYCDNRITLSHPKIRNFIKSGLIEASKSFGEFDIIAGVATAGIPHGMMLADALDKPFAYVRSKSKSHGRKNLIEGHIEKGSKVLVIEDLISTGMSSLAAVEAVQNVPAEVVGTLAIFSYGLEKAIKNFEDAQIKLHTLADYDQLIHEASESNYITQDQKELLAKWRENPAEWYDKNFN